MQNKIPTDEEFNAAMAKGMTYAEIPKFFADHAQKYLEQRETNRPIAPGIEPLIGQKFSVLDHGHVVVMDYMGNDAAIVQAARTSYQAGTKKVSEDKALIAYLRSHRHSTPFEMCEIKLHVRMPIFVARQMVRHRTASINEMSARYSILPNTFYVPENEHCAVQSTTNRQGRGATLSREEAQAVRAKIMEQSVTAYKLYEELLGMKIKDGQEELIDGGYDLARELARMVLPVNFYTEWVWKCDLHNLFHLLGLRADPHAQYEIRVYADIILDTIVKAWVPWAYEAFMEHQHEAVTFSRTERAMLADVMTVDIMVNVLQSLQHNYRLTDKKMAEFKRKLGL
jgi:thymidylate synthase (FAD)